MAAKCDFRLPPQTSKLEPVVFDKKTSPIGINHLLASCGFLPELAPVEMNGRTFVDGGLLINALSILFSKERSDQSLCYRSLLAQWGSSQVVRTGRRAQDRSF